MLLRLLEALKPWRWTGGPSTRDVWRVRTIQIVFPWTMGLWRARVSALAAEYTNRPLLNVLQGCRSSPIIVTVGFRDIVTPLVAAMGLLDVKIIAASPGSFESRRRGKLAMVQSSLDSEAIRQALFVTDSVEDLPLLRMCVRPLRTVWPQAKYRRALERVYLPGEYISRIKRPGQRYILRGILQEDFAYWLLSSISLAPHPALHIVGLLFLLLSFWAIYERGYVENDLVASRYEQDPKLSLSFHQDTVATPRVLPWAWAIAFSVAALFVLRWPAGVPSALFIKWGGVLLATHGWFLLYNRVDKSTRVWMYPVLQFARCAGLIAVVPVSPIGAVALGAWVLARSAAYETYRAVGRGWADEHLQSRMLLFFIVLATIIAVSQGPSIIFNRSTLALIAWTIYRARRELAGIIRTAKRLDRPRGTPSDHLNGPGWHSAEFGTASSSILTGSAELAALARLRRRCRRGQTPTHSAGTHAIGVQ